MLLSILETIKMTKFPFHFLMMMFQLIRKEHIMALIHLLEIATDYLFPIILNKIKCIKIYNMIRTPNLNLS